MTKQEKQLLIQRLAQFKINYNFTSRQLAQKIETTEAALSNWFRGHSLPRPEKVTRIKKLFKQYCIPGIIRLPKNSHWSASFFIRVEDIKDPYNTWVDDGWTGETPTTFSQWMSEWAITFPNPTIYRQYLPMTDPAICHLDLLNLNTTIQFRDCFIGHSSLEEIFSLYKGLCPSSFDYSLINKMMRGEDDGTT